MGILTWLFLVGPYGVFPRFLLVFYLHSKPGHLLRSQRYPWGLDKVGISVLTAHQLLQILKVIYALELPGEVAVPLLRDLDSPILPQSPGSYSWSGDKEFSLLDLSLPKGSVCIERARCPLLLFG